MHLPRLKSFESIGASHAHHVHKLCGLVWFLLQLLVFIALAITVLIQRGLSSATGCFFLQQLTTVTLLLRCSARNLLRFIVCPLVTRNVCLAEASCGDQCWVASACSVESMERACVYVHVQEWRFMLIEWVLVLFLVARTALLVTRHHTIDLRKCRFMSCCVDVCAGFHTDSAVSSARCSAPGERRWGMKGLAGREKLNYEPLARPNVVASRDLIQCFSPSLSKKLDGGRFWRKTSKLCVISTKTSERLFSVCKMSGCTEYNLRATYNYIIKNSIHCNNLHETCNGSCSNTRTKYSCIDYLFKTTT